MSPLPTPTRTTASTAAAAAAARTLLPTHPRSRGDLADSFEYDFRWAEPDEQPKTREHDADVVHLADDGQDVGDDVEWPHDVGEARDQQGLGERRHTTVAEQPPVEPNEVRQVRDHLHGSSREQEARQRAGGQPHAQCMTRRWTAVNRRSERVSSSPRGL